MNAQLIILMLADGILTIPSVLFLIAIFVLIAMSQSSKVENRKKAEEKIIELTQKGHDKLCSKCQGKGQTFWGICPKCGGLGYIYKLKESQGGSSNVGNKAELRKCVNCGAMIGKLEKSYFLTNNQFVTSATRD